MALLSGPFFGGERLRYDPGSFGFDDACQQKTLVSLCLAAVEADRRALDTEFLCENTAESLVGLTVKCGRADGNFQGVCMNSENLVPGGSRRRAYIDEHA